MGGEDFFAAENFLKPQKFSFLLFFFQKIKKKDFSKNSPINTNGSNYTNYNFFLIQKSLQIEYIPIELIKNLDFWTSQAIKQKKKQCFYQF